METNETRKHKTSVVAVAALGDWHIGAKVNAREVEYMNEYNWRIAQRRVEEFARSFAKWVNVQRAAYTIDEIAIVDLGDTISGLIHQELLIYNEFSIPQQVAKAGQLLGWFINEISRYFDKVSFYGMPADNHSRLFKKPMAAGCAEWSMASLVHEIAYGLVSANPKVKVFHSFKETKGIVKIADHNFLIEHGHTVKPYMGIPWYGMLRTRGLEASQRMGRPGKEFDYYMFGHWHTPFFGSGMLCNGSLMGTTEYDHQFGRYAPPSQTGFLVHPAKGIFNYIPFTLE